jgi:hypothetical protein
MDEPLTSRPSSDGSSGTDPASGQSTRRRIESSVSRSPVASRSAGGVRRATRSAQAA